MKNIVLFVFAVSSAQLFAHDISVQIDGPGWRPKLQFKDDYKVYEKHHDIIIENDEETQDVVISKDGDLWVNGEQVRVKGSERDLLIEYHDLATTILDKGEELGEEGVKVGLKGAELGFRAVSGVFKILLPGYTTQDFDEEMERASDKIEEKAKELEEQAEKLEVMGDHLQDIHDELRRAIEELEALDWF